MRNNEFISRSGVMTFLDQEAKAEAETFPYQ